jgi:hypothetical protein
MPVMSGMRTSVTTQPDFTRGMISRKALAESNPRALMPAVFNRNSSDSLTASSSSMT